MADPQHQGKFHLLVIVAVPVLFLLVFLVQNWFVLAGFLALLAAAVWWLFFRERG